MLNKKRGFSLAELLIALAIVSIIATMGLTIGKKSVAKAYDNYIYEGYKTLFDAICYIQALELELVSKTEEEDDDKYIISPVFINELKDIFSDEDSTTNTINTVNGIKYQVLYDGQSPESIPERVEHIITIKMTIPYVRRKDSSTADICLAFLPEDEYGILIPYEKGPHCKTSEEFSNIQNRKDLLTFWIRDDDDIVGNTNVDREDYVAIQYYSALVAICKNFGGNLKFLNSNDYIFKCPNPKLTVREGTINLKVKKH